MGIKVLKEVLTLKNLIITVIMSFCISKLTYDSLNNVLTQDYTIFDVTLNNYLIKDTNIDIIDLAKLYSIYLLIFYIGTKFVLENINNFSCYAMLRMKSIYKFLLLIFLDINIILIIYYAINYGISIVLGIGMSTSQIGEFGNFQEYMNLIFISFLLNYIISLSMILSTVALCIIFNNTNLIYGMIISIFSIGIISNNFYIPGSHTKLFIFINNGRILEIVGMYISIIIASISLTLYTAKNNKLNLTSLDIY